MTRRQWFVLGMLGLLAVSTPAFAEESADTIAALKTKAEAVSSYKTDFTLTVTEDDKPSVLKGTLTYQQPDKRRIEFAGDAVEDVAQLVVSDGTMEWQYFPGRKVAHKTDWAKMKAAGAPDEAYSIRGPHQPFLDLKPDSLLVVERKGGNVTIEADPLPALIAEAPFAAGKIRVIVAEADGLARRLVMTDAGGKEVLSQEYTNITTNAPVSDASFTFTPPEGVEVIDISEERAKAQ